MLISFDQGNSVICDQCKFICKIKVEFYEDFICVIKWRTHIRFVGNKDCWTELPTGISTKLGVLIPIFKQIEEKI